MSKEVKVFIMDALTSNSMKSSNPDSGFHEAQVSKCLDTSCLNPSCNQGGVMVCIALEGNGARPSHLGKGYSEDGKMFTLNTIEQHGVCYTVDCRNLRVNTDVSGTLQAKIMDKVNCLDCMHDQKIVLLEDDDMNNNQTNRKYVLRRLTPVECARLQGFPDWWCDGANGSDSAQYRLWGNGVALPCVSFIMGRIADVIGNKAGDNK